MRCGREEYKNVDLLDCLNLYDYQFKASRHSYGSTHLNSMVTTNQKHTIDSEKPKRKELKHTTKENQTIKEKFQTIKGKTQRRNEQRRTTKTTGKQSLKWQ